MKILLCTEGMNWVLKKLTIRKIGLYVNKDNIKVIDGNIDLNVLKDYVEKDTILIVSNGAMNDSHSIPEETRKFLRENVRAAFYIKPIWDVREIYMNNLIQFRCILFAELESALTREVGYKCRLEFDSALIDEKKPYYYLDKVLEVII